MRYLSYDQARSSEFGCTANFVVIRLVFCRWLAFKPPGTDRSGNAQYGYLDETRCASSDLLSDHGGFFYQGSILCDCALACSLSGLEYVWREGLHIGGLSRNPAADTLAPLYAEGSNALGYVMWNDEPGKSHCAHGCTSFILGHSKGVLPNCNQTLLH